MNTESTVTIIVSVIVAAVMLSLGVNAAYAYSSSVSADDNGIDADFLSIDYYKGNGDPISSGDYVSFGIDQEATAHCEKGHIIYVPTNPLVIRVSADHQCDFDLIGAFSFGAGTVGYGAAIKSVRFVFETDVDCELGGNHAGIAPTVLNRTLSGSDGLYTYSFTIQEINVFLMNTGLIQTDGSGNVYISVDGEPGTFVPLEDMKDFDKLTFMFYAVERQA